MLHVFIQMWNGMSINQGIAWAARNHQRLGEMHGTESASKLPVGTNPGDTLILDFQPYSCERIYFCSLKPLSCDTLLWQP